MLKDKKRQDELDIQKFERKQYVQLNASQVESEEIKKICKEYKIDLKNRKLPYKDKIRQICNSLSAYYRYK